MYPTMWLTRTARDAGLHSLSHGGEHEPNLAAAHMRHALAHYCLGNTTCEDNEDVPVHLT